MPNVRTVIANPTNSNMFLRSYRLNFVPGSTGSGHRSRALGLIMWNCNAASEPPGHVAVTILFGPVSRLAVYVCVFWFIVCALVCVCLPQYLSSFVTIDFTILMTILCTFRF